MLAMGETVKKLGALSSCVCRGIALFFMIYFLLHFAEWAMHGFRIIR